MVHGEDRIQTQLTPLGAAIEELGSKIRVRGDESDLDVLEYFAELESLVAHVVAVTDESRAAAAAHRSRLVSERKSA